LFDGPIELSLREGGGEVEQGPGGARDGDAVLAGRVTGMQASGVGADPGAVPGLAPGHGHVDRSLLRWSQSPQRGGGVVAQQRPWTDREHGRHRAAVLARQRSDQIHAPMAAPKPARADPMRDCIPAEAGVSKLRRRHDRVLPASHRQHRPIAALNRHFVRLEPPRHGPSNKLPLPPALRSTPPRSPLESNETPRPSGHPPSPAAVRPPPPHTCHGAGPHTTQPA
jgi:hypothetical protein